MKTDYIDFVVRVKVGYERQNKAERVKLARSVIGKNSCFGAGVNGSYDAKVTSTVLKKKKRVTKPKRTEPYNLRIRGVGLNE